jgi:hypothetical protein
LTFHQHCIVYSVPTLFTQLPNMPKKSAAQQKKVDAAVRILVTTTGVKVPQAMILAGFSKQDIANETIRRMIHRRFEAKQTTPCHDVIIRDIEVAANGSDISPLNGDDEHTTTTLTMTTLTAAPTHPKPKRKQIRAMASAVQQRRIDDQALRRHKSDVHMAAVHLWDSERKKPDGMSICKVCDAIMEKYETCPGIATISHYASQAEESLAVDRWTRRIQWRGSGNRVNCWVGFSAWVFPRAERQGMGKSWSSPYQPEVPLKPKGPPLNR